MYTLLQCVGQLSFHRVVECVSVVMLSNGKMLMEGVDDGSLMADVS